MVSFSALSNTPHEHVLHTFHAGEINNAFTTVIPKGRKTILVMAGQVVAKDDIIADTISAICIQRGERALKSLALFLGTPSVLHHSRQARNWRGKL